MQGTRILGEMESGRITRGLTRSQWPLSFYGDRTNETKQLEDTCFTAKV